MVVKQSCVHNQPLFIVGFIDYRINICSKNILFWYIVNNVLISANCVSQTIMATSVLLACGLNEQQLPSFTYIREETDVDASFLITCILGQRIKVPNSSTVLLSLHHAFQHYSLSGQRLGFNLNAARDKGGLLVTEPFQDIFDEMFASDIFQNNDDALIQRIWTQLLAQVQDELDIKSKKTMTIIVDDLSTFMNLGASENSIILLVRQLVRLASSKYADRLFIVAKLNTSNLFDLLNNNLEALADAEIQCNKLKSGNFRDVDGRLVNIRPVKKGLASNSDISGERLKKTMLYKVNERNVKIFAPGEVGIKV